MILSSSQLEAFSEVAKTKSFSLAAKNLHITQSALSQRVLNLESELSTGLIIRDPAGLRLTPAGEELLRYCITKDSLEREFLSKLSVNQKELRGILRIAGTSSVMRSVVMPSLQDFIGKNPHIHIECYSRELRDLPGMLSSGEADMIVTSAPSPRHDVVAHALGHEENMLVESITANGRQNIYLDHDSDDTTTLEFCKMNAIKIDAIQRNYLDEVYSILDAVRFGWGRAVLAKHLIKGVADIRICKGFKALKTPVYLQYFRQPYYAQLHSRAVDCLNKKAPTILSK